MDWSVFTELLASYSLFVMIAHTRQFCLQLWNAASLSSDNCTQKVHYLIWQTNTDDKAASECRQKLIGTNLNSYQGYR